MKTSDVDRLLTIPLIGLSESFECAICRFLKVTIPRETNTNWPKMEAEMTEGYSIYIQKCQEQFKIYVQHKVRRFIQREKKKTEKSAV